MESFEIDNAYNGIFDEHDGAVRTLKKFYWNEIINPYRKSDKVMDMHTHTSYSDGDLNPSQLIRLAVEKKISILGITDHDTLDGVKTINRHDSLIQDSGIEIINGIELSVFTEKGRMHMLGYDIDINNDSLNKKMIELKDNSINSVLSLIEQLKRDYGIYFGYDDIKELVNATHNLGRVDLAKLCVKYKYATSIQEAFDKYLIDAHNKTRCFNNKLSYEEAISLIIKGGGIPVLAHPKSLEMSKKDFLILLKEMINLGLKGIEVYHSSHTLEEQDEYLKLANKYDLLVSGGSDFHGPMTKPDVKLGTGKNNNIKIKSLSLVDYIKMMK